MDEEVRRLVIAGVVCAAIGAGLAVAVLAFDLALQVRLLLLFAGLLGAGAAKLTGAIVNCAGEILLIPAACLPSAALVTLMIALGGLPPGDNPVWIILLAPVVVYFSVAWAVIRMEW